MSDFSGLPPVEPARPRAWRVVGLATLVVSAVMIVFVGFLVWLFVETFSVDFSF